MIFNDVTTSLMRGQNLFDLPFRVVYYARVSTDSDVQLNSLENQQNYYMNYIKSKKNWTYVGEYIEEGVSGVTVEKRSSFKRMIRDAKNGLFDLIITKEVSRFARDLEDSIHYIRELKESNVGIYFENQNLNTFDPNSELILNIMFNLAQDESRKLSSRVKFGHKEAINKGHVLGSSNIIGYKKDKCKLVIVEEEARLVKKIFELYATGEYGFYKLSRCLNEMGYVNKKGNFYDKDTLKRIIENPKYKGFYRARVNEVIDYRTKKRKKNKVEDQVIYKCTDDTVPAIVSEELWDKANQVLFNRTKSYKKDYCYSGSVKYALSSKIYCHEHNVNYQRSHGSKKKNRPIWACGMYLQHRISACCSPIIAESDLYNLLGIVIKKIILEKKIIIHSMIELYSSIDKSNEYDIELKKIENQIMNIESQKRNVIKLITNQIITEDDVKIQFDTFKKELEVLSNKKHDILKQMETFKQNKNNIKELQGAITEEINGGFLEEFIRKFVDEIIVTKIDNDRHNLKLDIYLNLLDNQKKQHKGAKYINASSNNEILYMKNQKLSTIENVRNCNTPNMFTYNVYVETL